MDINEKLNSGFKATKEGKPFALIIRGENGSGKTAFFRNFFENNGIRYYQIECKTLLPLGEKNAYDVTTEDVLNFSLDGYDAVFFDAIDRADNQVRELLLKKVKEIKEQNVFVGATCWPSAHYDREPIKEEVLKEYFDEVIDL